MKEKKENLIDVKNNLLKNKPFIKFVLQEVEFSSKLLLETNNAIKIETDPWKKREKLQILSNTISNLDTIIENLKDIDLLQSESVPLYPKKIDIINILTEHISKYIKNSKGPRILPKFPLNAVFYVIDENRFKTLIDDLIKFSESLLEKKGTILIEVFDSKKELLISTSTHPVKIEVDENLSGFEFSNKDSKIYKNNISKIFAYRIETIINLLSGDIIIDTKSPENLKVNLIFKKE
tara:strand:- start:15592 stop:16299 length:708 start_codon:yes stop_codon:yes gene_type:complete